MLGAAPRPPFEAFLPHASVLAVCFGGYEELVASKESDAGLVRLMHLLHLRCARNCRTSLGAHLVCKFGNCDECASGLTAPAQLRPGWARVTPRAPSQAAAVPAQPHLVHAGNSHVCTRGTAPLVVGATPLPGPPALPVAAHNQADFLVCKAGAAGRRRHRACCMYVSFKPGRVATWGDCPRSQGGQRTERMAGRVQAVGEHARALPGRLAHRRDAARRAARAPGRAAALALCRGARPGPLSDCSRTLLHAVAALTVLRKKGNK